MPTAPIRRPFSKRPARRISATVKGAAVYELSTPLFVNGEVHERVIVASAHGETHIFPVFGAVRVLAKTMRESASFALASIGYEAA